MNIIIRKRMTRISGFKFFLILWLSTIASGCNSRDNSTNSTNDKVELSLSSISQSWKIDSLGCKGKRYKLVDSLSMSTLRGLESKQISMALEIFGNPDTLIDFNGKKAMIYFLECPYVKGKESPKGRSRLLEAAIFAIEFEEVDEQIDKVKVMVP